MPGRLRRIIVVAIFIALAAHSFAHPVLKECPCVQAVPGAYVERSDSFVLPLLAERPDQPVEQHADPAVVSLRSPRAPPTA